MRFVFRSVLLSLSFGFLLGSPAIAGGSNDLVTIYIPAFNGPRELGLNVATVLNLQIWRTLRMAAEHKTFGRGLVVWETQPLTSQSFESADELARVGLDLSDGKRVYPQLVFWGNTREFGGGIVVECFLSIPPSYTGNARDKWAVTIHKDGIDHHIHADLPQRRYEFSTITLSKDLVDTYSKPTALQIYPTRDAKYPIGSVGKTYEARQQLDGWVLLESDGLVGWVPLPKLSKNRNELVDFVGGVIRILRSDWNGANALFEKVVRNAQAPSALKVDALLYQVMAKSKAGQNPEETLQLVRHLAPFYRATTMYSVMSKLDAMSRTASEGHPNKGTKTIIQQIETELSDGQQLFLPDDPWLTAVIQLLHTLRTG
ncbi:MAG: hypothetical protein QM771_17715 [Nitrospira sp.]